MFQINNNLVDGKGAPVAAHSSQLVLEAAANDGADDGVDDGAAADIGYSNPCDIQRMLDENAATIGAIVEYRGMGREDEATQLQTLHRNLMQLTSLTNLMHLTTNTEDEEEKEVDFRALKSLSDDGIDMSFLDALKDKYEKEKEEEEVSFLI